MMNLYQRCVAGIVYLVWKFTFFLHFSLSCFQLVLWTHYHHSHLPILSKGNSEPLFFMKIFVML